MQWVSLAVGLALGIAGLAFLIRGRIADSWVWLAVVVGAVMFPVALLVKEPINRLLFRALGGSADPGGVAIAAATFVAAAIEETIKLTAALSIINVGRRGPALASAVGAAVGAGFAVYAAYGLLRGTFDLWRDAPALIGTTGLVMALGLRFAGILTHIATTSIAALGAARGRTFVYLAAAILIQTALGLLDRLLVLLRQTPASLLSIVGGLAVYAVAYAFARDGRPELLAERSADAPSAGARRD